MRTAKIVLSVTYGLLFAILSIGILPFLLVYAFVDINGLSDVYPPPFFILPAFLRDNSRDGDGQSGPKNPGR